MNAGEEAQRARQCARVRLPSGKAELGGVPAPVGTSPLVTSGGRCPFYSCVESQGKQFCYRGWMLEEVQKSLGILRHDEFANLAKCFSPMAVAIFFLWRTFRIRTEIGRA